MIDRFILAGVGEIPHRILKKAAKAISKVLSNSSLRNWEDG